MTIVGLTTSIKHNRMRLIFLISLIPLLVFLSVWGFFYFYPVNAQYEGVSNSLLFAAQSTALCLPIILVWLFISIYFQKQIIFKFTGAKEITRKQYPDVYNIVENLCISRGLITPKIGIIDDSSINAFATGWTKKSSWVVFSKGAITKLDKDELEAVAGHELTHIINDDVKVMVITNIFIGVIGTIGEVLMRTGNSRSNKKGGNPLPLLGLFLYVLSIVILPLINLAISRKKEFLADAGSVKLTKNKDAMINALKKIEKDSVIEQLSKKNSSVEAMFIGDPKKQKKGFTSSMNNLLSTHPSISKRVEMLEKY